MGPLHERLAAARQALTAAGVPDHEATLDAELLARHVLECDRSTLVMRGRDPLPSAFDTLFNPLVARRAAREPIAYIVGRQEFWGLEFEVTPDVLIPRPETELIVEEAISSIERRDLYRHIIDVGTGSGCIAVALAVEFPRAQLVATDRSEAALAVARRNAARHGVDDRITFVHTDLLDGVGDDAQLIVSNPPYVSSADRATLQPEVGQYEPDAALFAGADGLDVIRRLLAAAPSHLADRGLMLVEFGFGQDAAVRAAAQDAGWTVARIREDLQGIPRVAALRREP
jgi:release factor glutamine methyltransferase